MAGSRATVRLWPFIASDALIPIFSIAAVHGADMIEMLTPVHVLHAVGSNSVSDL